MAFYQGKRALKTTRALLEAYFFAVGASYSQPPIRLEKITALSAKRRLEDGPAQGSLIKRQVDGLRGCVKKLLRRNGGSPLKITLAET